MSDATPTLAELFADDPRRAERFLEESFTARRSLLFNNPGLPTGGTTHTLLMGIQMIKPGEIAWAHRHTLAAIRFADSTGECTP